MAMHEVGWAMRVRKLKAIQKKTYIFTSATFHYLIITLCPFRRGPICPNCRLATKRPSLWRLCRGFQLTAHVAASPGASLVAADIPARQWVRCGPGHDAYQPLSRQLGWVRYSVAGDGVKQICRRMPCTGSPSFPTVTPPELARLARSLSSSMKARRGIENGARSAV